MIKTGNKTYDSCVLQNLTPIQQQYMEDESRFIWNPSGRRSRKTLLGMHKLIIRASLTPGLYFEAAPTHGQAYHIFWDELEMKLRYSGLLLNMSKSLRSFKIKSINGVSTIQVVGLDEPRRIEGKAIRGIHITEFPDIKVKDFWNTHIRPMLADEVQGAPIWVIADGTYDSKCDDWTDLIESKAGGSIGVPEVGKPIYKVNPTDPDNVVYIWHSGDVLPEAEIAQLKKEYDRRLFDQEFGGKAMRDGARIFYSYSEKNNSDIKFNTSRKTWLSFDFNPDPFVCTVWQQAEINGQTCKVCVKDFSLYDSNAKYGTPHIIEWLQKQNFNPSPGQLVLTGDHNGNSRLGASKPAWMIVTELFNRAGMIHTKMTKHSKPGSVRDGQESLNFRFEPYEGKPYYYVNQDICRDLHSDLMKLKRKDDGTQNDESGKRGHWCDTARYLCYNFDRLKRKATIKRGA